MTIIRTQGNSTGHGWYNHLYFCPELGKGMAKRVHGDEPWWPVSLEQEAGGHNHGRLLEDIRNGQTQAELSSKGWRDHCFVSGEFSETREVTTDVDGFLVTK